LTASVVKVQGFYERGLGVQFGISKLKQLSVVILIGDQVRSTGLKMKRVAKTQIIPTRYPFIGTFNMRDDAKEDVLRTFVRVAEMLNIQNH
jgi:hypothetical protein